MKTEEKNSSQKVRIAVLGNMNVGKSGELIHLVCGNISSLNILSISFYYEISNVGCNQAKTEPITLNGEKSH